MKAKKLIKKLQELVDEHGNFEVVRMGCGGCMEGNPCDKSFPIDQVYCDESFSGAIVLDD